MMEKLKACPHCGGKAVFERFNNPKNWFVVRCTVCGCQTDGFRINHDDATDAQNKSANAAVWNRRAEPENKPLTLEQLQQMDGNPAYVKNIVHPDCTGWKVCGGSFDGYIYFSNGETYELSHYGQTWLAYARKPEGSEKK